MHSRNTVCTLVALIATGWFTHSTLAADDSDVTSPAPYQVIQRSSKNAGDIHCGGIGKEGMVRARVTGDGKPLNNFDWQEIGKVEAGKWSGLLKGVPVGGPYTIEFDLGGHASSKVTDVLVGDLWILAGQSNMQGIGDMIDVEPPSPMVHTFESRYQWAIAEEPLHRLSESANAVQHLLMTPNATPEDIERIRHAPRQPVAKGAGLGLPFAKELYARTKVPIGLLPCAHGGTSMDQWDPAKKSEGGKSLYGAMLDRVHTVGGKVKGVLWYQGESDSNAERQAGYYKKMVGLIEATRNDLGDPSLPFYLVQLGRVFGMNRTEEPWSAVREDERRLGEDIPGVVTIPAVDLELDDTIHIGTQGLKRLGRRFALAADHELFGNKPIAPSIHFKSAVVENGKAGVVRVTFTGVNGRLKPAAHISGFSLRSKTGEVVGEFFDVMVDPKQPDNIICQSAQPIPDGANLWYGYGTNPYCNLIDEQDMAAPTFGPIPLKPPATQKAP